MRKNVAVNLKYIGICLGGPWANQEVKAERPVIARGIGIGRGCQYFHENGVWYYETPETMKVPQTCE